MLKPAVQRCLGFRFLMPGRIIVPTYHIQIVFKFPVIQSQKIIHKIGGYRFFISCLPDGLNLKSQEIYRSVCDKPLPVQIQPVKIHFSYGGRALHLIKTLICMAPERCTPAIIQPADGSILFLQPLSEFLLAQRTVAFPTVLIGNMPKYHAWMASQMFYQLSINLLYLLPIDRGRITVVVAAAKQGSSPLAIHPQHLRIFISQPLGPGTGRGSQNSRNSVFIKPVYHILQPLNLNVSFLRLQAGPRKHAKAYSIDPCLFKIFHILFQNIRSVQPLFRIIITTVQQSLSTKSLIHIFHSYSSLSFL